MSKLRLALVMVATIWSVPAFADSPLLPIQGRLTDSAGSPIHGSRTVVFAIYADAVGGAAIYQETQDVGFSNGNFVAYIGDITALDPSLFDGAPRLWLGIRIQGDAEMQPRFRLGSAPTAAYAQTCGDAMTVGGKDVSALTSASASSFIPSTNPKATQAYTWVCEFGAAQLTVEAGQRLLITGQGTARFEGTGGGYGEVSLAVAWREAGETSSEIGHPVTHWSDFVSKKKALHVTELTPALAAGVYELGVCTRKSRYDFDSVTVLDPYGTALVINTGN